MAQGVKAIARTPLFVSLVYPEVLRQILTRLFVIDRRDPSDAGEERGWVESWYNLASALNPDPMPALDREDVEARLGWIDAAVSRFARNSGALDRFERGWSQ